MRVKEIRSPQNDRDKGAPRPDPVPIENLEYTSFDYRKVSYNGFVGGVNCSTMNGY